MERNNLANENSQRVLELKEEEEDSIHVYQTVTVLKQKKILISPVKKFSVWAVSIHDRFLIHGIQFVDIYRDGMHVRQKTRTAMFLVNLRYVYL